MGGGGMLKTVHRAARAGIGGASQEHFSHSTTTRTTNPNNSLTYYSKSSSTTSNTTLSLSSSSPSTFSALNLTPNWAANNSKSPTCSEEFDWECIDEIKDGGVSNGFYDDFVFGTVPSIHEVQHAASSLQYDVSDKIISPAGSELDWVEPSLQLCNSRTLQSPGSDRVYDVFHLLQTEPPVKRMVISLSSDKAVWDAVLNNDVVRELRESLHEEKSVSESSDEGSDDGSNAVTDIFCWIFINTKAKVIEIIEKITKLVNDLFQPSCEKEKRSAADPFEEN